MVPIKLHLGCGNKKIHGYVNIDIRSEVRPDIVYDIANINKLFKNEANVIYACHVLEHFPQKPSKFAPISYFEVLQNWFEVLKSGGILRLSVPNFEACIERYLVNKNIDELHGLLYGGQKNDYDFHYTTFTFKKLQYILEKNGFINIKEYDWRKTDHCFVDDYSQSYLPHMDKENGKLMSLNIEAQKK